MGNQLQQGFSSQFVRPLLYVTWFKKLLENRWVCTPASVSVSKFSHTSSYAAGSRHFASCSIFSQNFLAGEMPASPVGSVSTVPKVFWITIPVITTVLQQLLRGLSPGPERHWPLPVWEDVEGPRWTHRDGLR